MPAPDVFNEFLKLDEDERQRFFSQLMLWCDLHLPDTPFLVLSYEQYQRMARIGVREMPENPALYDVAKQVCHSFDLPWTDPRTGEVHPPAKKKLGDNK